MYKKALSTKDVHTRNASNFSRERLSFGGVDKNPHDKHSLNINSPDMDLHTNYKGGQKLTDLLDL